MGREELHKETDDNTQAGEETPSPACVLILNQIT